MRLLSTPSKIGDSKMLAAVSDEREDLILKDIFLDKKEDLVNGSC